VTAAQALWTSVAGSRVLVTGASGKVGRVLVARLLAGGAQVRILTRDPATSRSLWPGTGIDARAGDIVDPESLHGLVDGIETVFHLASYAPAPDEPDIYECPAHWTVTAEGTRNLCDLIARSGVQRLVYLSTVKAMGEEAGGRGGPADETDAPRPDTLYGRAKRAAEERVLLLGRERAIHSAVIRLPMVYGLPGAGNLARLIDAVARHRFPPWPRLDNHRSAVHVEDVAGAAILAAGHPAAAGEVYLVTDGHPYSTRWLYEQVLSALGRPLPRWRVPLWTLRAAASIGSVAERLSGRAMPLTRVGLAKLTGDAWFSSEKIRRELGFEAERALREEIPRLVSDYLAEARLSSRRP
jgi:UDP-glucose 4-epimerase